MKKQMEKMLPAIDAVLMPFVYLAAWLLKRVRKTGVQRLPLCKRTLMNVGVFPIRNHYYEPQFDNRFPNQDFSKDRNLSGIDWNVSGQLEMLEKLSFSEELS